MLMQPSKEELAITKKLYDENNTKEERLEYEKQYIELLKKERKEREESGRYYFD